MGTLASANLDDVRRAFYNDYVSAANPETLWWWIRAVLTDPNELIVEDDESGQLYKLPFESDTKGGVSFGEAAAVRIDYIPDDRESQKAAASSVAATLEVGRKVAASWPTRAASRPDNTGGAMDPKEVRKALGLPEDASDEQVHEALVARSLTTNDAGEVVLVEPTAAAPVEGEPVAPPAAPVAPAAPAAVEPVPVPIAAGSLPPGTVLVDEEQWKLTQAGLARATTLADKIEAGENEGLVTAAIGDGRVPPSRKDFWLDYIKVDPEGGKAALASLKPNIVPITERGHGHAPDDAGSMELEAETVSEWSRQLFPEVRNMHAAAAAAAEGRATRTRVMSDAHYGRR